MLCRMKEQSGMFIACLSGWVLAAMILPQNESAIILARMRFSDSTALLREQRIASRGTEGGP